MNAARSSSPARRLALCLLVLGGSLVVVAALALFMGSAALPPRAVIAALTGGGASGDAMESSVVLGLRLPRIAAAILAGGALALAGGGLQAITRNPLADPSVLGVSSGAAFGVVMGQLWGLRVELLGALGLAACGFAGASGAGLLVYAIAARAGGLPVHSLLLAGVIVALFFGSLITVIISIVDADRLGGVVHWLLGAIAPVPPHALAVFALLTAVGALLVVSQARRLNVLALGEETAAQLGADPERVKRRIFAGASLLTGTVVALAGPIGFVGLIVPQSLRLVIGPDHRVLLPAALVGGGAFLLAADTVARTAVAPAELAVGVITSLCGAPFFVALLRSRAAAAVSTP